MKRVWGAFRDFESFIVREAPAAPFSRALGMRASDYYRHGVRHITATVDNTALFNFMRTHGFQTGGRERWPYIRFTEDGTLVTLPIDHYEQIPAYLEVPRIFRSAAAVNFLRSAADVELQSPFAPVYRPYRDLYQFYNDARLLTVEFEPVPEGEQEQSGGTRANIDAGASAAELAAASTSAGDSGTSTVPKSASTTEAGETSTARKESKTEKERHHHRSPSRHSRSSRHESSERRRSSSRHHSSSSHRHHSSRRRSKDSAGRDAKSARK